MEEVRSYEDVEATLTNAKLEQSELLSECQCISFDESFPSSDLKLIELDKNSMEFLKVGKRLIIRGEPEDSTFICTDSETYEIKEAEMSNSLLLLEDLKFPQDIVSSSAYTDTEPSEPLVTQKTIVNAAHSYLEMRKVQPNMNRIRKILEPSAYKGPNFESKFQSLQQSLVTFNHLLDKVPGSKKEIEVFLRKIKAVDLNGFIRLIDTDYLFRALTSVIDFIEGNDRNSGNVKKTDVIDALKGHHPQFILEEIFSWFFLSNSEDENETDYSPNEYEISRFYGEALIRPIGRLNLKDFLKAWQQSIPEGMNSNFSQLEGLAVVDFDASPQTITYLPEHVLPQGLPERFAVLFDTKIRWKYEEIFPYVEKLASSTSSVGSILTKYCRVSNESKVKYFSAKHSK